MEINHTAAMVINFKFQSFVFLGLLVCLFTAQPVLAAEDSKDEWKWAAKFYIWTPDIDMEDSSGEDSTISFNEILKNLDMTFMGGIVGRKDRFGFLVDAVYLDLSANEKNHQGPFLIHTKTELQAIILTPVAIYRVVEDDQFNLDILGGVRYMYLDVKLKRDVLDDLGDDGSTINGVVGFRGNVQLNENWYAPFYYDVGKGDSELTYQAFAGINYKLSSFDLSAGYRYMKFKFDDDDDFGEVLNNLVVKGPMFGARFYF